MNKNRMIMTIANFLSEEECAFWRNYCKYARINESKEVTLRRNGELTKVDRNYYTVRDKFKFCNQILLDARKAWKTDDLHFQKRAYFHIMHYKNSSEGLEWHNEGRISTISVSINISPDDHYKGAEFQIQGSDVKVPYRAAIFYQSEALHRVTPLISGEKFSIVTWLPNIEQKAKS